MNPEPPNTGDEEKAEKKKPEPPNPEPPNTEAVEVSLLSMHIMLCLLLSNMQFYHNNT